jgi:dihydroorotate dehydrogenase
VPAWGALGFGFAEVGTVTAVPQEGNPKPRIFRLPADGALVNRLGFNNDGAARVAERLARRALRADPHPVPIGVNIGKSRAASAEAAADDYARSADALWPYADYLVVNVSSPNTPGLRDLQAVERLRPLLEHVRRVADEATTTRVPLLVKIAPDLADKDVLEVADLALALGLDGIVATNTTTSREGLATDAATMAEIGAGGVSGRPVADRAEAVLRMLRDRVGPSMTLIGVGGISTSEDARARLDAGATLLQGYTAFVYEGPLWPRRIVKGIKEVDQ